MRFRAAVAACGACGKPEWFSTNPHARCRPGPGARWARGSWRAGPIARPLILAAATSEVRLIRPQRPTAPAGRLACLATAWLAHRPVAWRRSIISVVGDPATRWRRRPAPCSAGGPARGSPAHADPPRTRARRGSDTTPAGQPKVSVSARKPWAKGRPPVLRARRAPRTVDHLCKTRAKRRRRNDHEIHMQLQQIARTRIDPSGGHRRAELSDSDR